MEFRRYLYPILLVLPALVAAEPQKWMKKENPNELGFLTFIGAGCSNDPGELIDVLTGVLTRARIKTTEFSLEPTGQLGVLVRLSCYSVGMTDSEFFSVDVEFISSVEEPNGMIMPVRYLAGSEYAGVGLLDKHDIPAKAKEVLEKAITDYIEANFDLGDE